MPELTEKDLLENLSDEDFEKIAFQLDKLGITDRIESSYRVSARVLGYAVDFMKKLGVLNEFVLCLPYMESKVFVEMFKQRPKMYGGNPFE